MARDRRWIWVVVFGAASTAGCFIDAGSSSGDATSATSDAEESVGASTSSGATAVTTAPGTSATTSSGSSGSNLTSSTSSSDTCQGVPECQPGATQSGEACGGCSVDQRVCGEDCTWGPWACVADESACAVWILRDGAREWDARPIELNGAALNTPDDPIQAAFNLELGSTAFVLTEKEYHGLDLESLTWNARGDREDMFDQATEQNLEGAVSINTGQSLGEPPTSAERIVLYSDEDYWVFLLEVNELIAEFVEEGPCCGDTNDWLGPLAPDPADMRAIWLDMIGNPAWNPINLVNCPPLMDGTPLTSYAGYAVIDDTVRLREYSGCGQFVGSFGYAEYAPFTYPNRPPAPEELGAALFHDGDLYVFKSDI